MPDNSTFQYSFDTDVITDHESMIGLLAEGALWAAQKSRESFGAYAGVSRYAAIVLEDPFDFPPGVPFYDFIHALFGSKPRKACRCRCLPPSENMPSPDSLLPDPCALGNGPAGKTNEEKALKAIYMHPLYVTAKSNDGAGSKELDDISTGDIVWVDRKTKTIIGMCETADIPRNTTAGQTCAASLAALISGQNFAPEQNPPYAPYTPASQLPDYSHIENAIDATVIETFIKANGHPWFEGDYQLNIVGVQNSEAGPPPTLTNLFDDFITVTYKVNGVTQFRIWPFTSRPGHTWLVGNPQSNGTIAPMNPLGTGFIPTHKTSIQEKGAYGIRLHNGKYEALGTNWDRQQSHFRDPNWDTNYDQVNLAMGNTGMNIHRSSTSANGGSGYVNKYSAGCQVFANIGHWQEFMTLARKHEEVWGVKTFSYILIDSAELPAGRNA